MEVCVASQGKKLCFINIRPLTLSIVLRGKSRLYLGGKDCTSGEEILYLAGKIVVLRGKKHCTSGET